MGFAAFLRNEVASLRIESKDGVLVGYLKVSTRPLISPEEIFSNNSIRQSVVIFFASGFRRN